MSEEEKEKRGTEDNNKYTPIPQIPDYMLKNIKKAKEDRTKLPPLPPEFSFKIWPRSAIRLRARGVDNSSTLTINCYTISLDKKISTPKQYVYEYPGNTVFSRVLNWLKGKEKEWKYLSLDEPKTYSLYAFPLIYVRTDHFNSLPPTFWSLEAKKAFVLDNKGITNFSYSRYNLPEHPSISGGLPRVYGEQVLTEEAFLEIAWMLWDIYQEEDEKAQDLAKQIKISNELVGEYPPKTLS